MTNLRRNLFPILLAIVAVLSASAAQISLKSAAVGTVNVSAELQQQWRMTANIEAVGGKEVITINLGADTPCELPRLEVQMAFPQLDMHHLWNSNSSVDRCWLRPNWAGFYNSSLAVSMPLYSLFNDNNRNRITLACNESLRQVNASIGLKEEGAEVVAIFRLFEVPDAPVSHYQTQFLIDGRDIFWSDALSEASEWMMTSAGLTPCRVPEAAFDPLYSSWYQFHQNVSDKAIEQECRIASEMGMKTIIVDDGWQTDDNNRGYAFCGDWEVSKNRFPDMRTHVAKVQAMGMKYMMWYSVPYVGRHSKAYERFKGKYLWESDRDNIAAFDPRFPEVREYLCSVYERALREWNLDGFKLDFIDTFRPSANDPAVAENYAGRDIKSVTEATNVLMNQVREHLQAIKPDLLIEFRQEYIGPAIRQYGNMLRAGDCPGDMAANRIRTANLRITSGHTAVHADMIEWNVDESPEVAARHILSALFSTIQYSMMLCDISPEQRAMIKHWIDFTQCHRTTLLKSSFRPYHPELCYPLIEAESADELISAVYADNAIATVAFADKTVYVVNATGQGSVVVDLAAAPRRIEAFDTYGNPVKVAKPKAGVSRINVPVSGYIRLDYK